uniref:non-specific serine/threonine protein kinase n=1 Tax=Lygus hesperus TaxID=30085 RepID=A0A146LBU4_LYGHE
MRNEDSDFLSLKTVSSFDSGDAQTLAVGVTPQDLHNFSPSSLLIESLIEQICSLMEKNPSTQRKLYLDVCKKLHQMNLIGESYEREEFQFMRSHYQKALYHLLSIAKTTKVEQKAIVPNFKPHVPLENPGNAIEWSRYRTEFQELEYIAKGGFGHVYKAQHKLDGEIYAIKKIFLRYHSVGDFLQNLREVKMLAKLNHPNIVAYKAAWLEATEERKKKVEITDISSEETSVEYEKSRTEDSLEVVFESSENNGGENALGGREQFHAAVNESSESDESTYGANCSKNICKYQSNSKYQFHMNVEAVRQSAVLFIQMQLCHKTLRQWLDVRNQEMMTLPDQNEIMAIFKQIVLGVEYIHSQGIVHHDIKPSNIFVSHDLRIVQVGDFGLACCLLAHPQSSLSVVATHHTGQLGTKLYAAPEQLRGACHAKSDVYSLGIVLFELIQPFTTSMERSKVIAQLRGGHIPTDLIANYNNVATVISQAVTSLKKRPTSSELLAILTETQNEKNDLVVEEQNETIKALRRESMAKDEEIVALKRQLEELKKRLDKNNTEISPL